ncbi:unnamed protein product [Caenorhabditis auriculariae]|uniref:Uncharacterized protein n=1 Tax=Caenorhabditis auriculariae TaxID=2777116 RepID=A0A8S1GQK0_9PELO|nr:unnamed protein product [Caenorhabditis auriculariae]
MRRSAVPPPFISSRYASLIQITAWPVSDESNQTASTIIEAFSEVTDSVEACSEQTPAPEVLAAEMLAMAPRGTPQDTPALSFSASGPLAHKRHVGSAWDDLRQDKVTSIATIEVSNWRGTVSRFGGCAIRVSASASPQAPPKEHLHFGNATSERGTQHIRSLAPTGTATRRPSASLSPIGFQTPSDALSEPMHFAENKRLLEINSFKTKKSEMRLA